MSEPTSSSPPGPARRVPTSAEQHRWLTGELREWERQGLVTAPAAAAIADRYVVSGALGGHRITPVRVVLGLGALGVGYAWWAPEDGGAP